MTLPDTASFTEWLAHARLSSRKAGTAVLDELIACSGMPAEALAPLLDREAGVRSLRPDELVRPDFSALDQAFAAANRCVALQGTGGEPHWAAEDPWDPALQRHMGRLLRTAAPPIAASRRQMDEWLALAAPAAPSAPGAHDKVRSQADDSPVVAFVNDAIEEAVRQGASDIHLECDRAGVAVKHRLDGVMVAFNSLKGRDRAEEVVSRIKVLAQLDITERRIPQDGRFHFGRGPHDGIDFRVSIMPSIHGEDAVLRLLDKAQLRSRGTAASLDLLGFGARHADLIRELASQPSGMLLVTGPTGSGKTTTLYAVLSEINDGREKLITIEDPVEYELPGVLQIPVNERKGLTFAKGLRSILRHDPDRILVGEIRDPETAEIAVQSALTGHLVFTTVHANAMSDIVGRFRHFDMDMFGFMSALNGVVVQRLIRRLCPQCQTMRDATPGESAWLLRMGQPGDAPVPKAVGCPACAGTGYRGRFVLAEVHRVDDVLRDQVTEGAPVSALKRHLEASGLETLQAQAARQVVVGRTTMEEIRRVVGWA